MIASPLTVDVRRGAITGLRQLLAEGGISAGGKVAVLVGPGQGEAIAEVLAPTLSDADVLPVEDASVDAARDLAVKLRQSSYDAVVGIGGGRTLDVAKYTASLTGLPMVAVATNLSHDGIASPVASLEHEGRKGSYGVHIPLAVFVDLDYVQRAPQRMVRSGIGDVVSNLSALADWQLAADERGEQIDGLAAAMARAAADAVVFRPDSIDSVDFLVTLAEALILSGLAMAVAGSSRPCSGGDHEILHAIDQLYPGVSNHGELAGVGALFCAFLRGDDHQQELIDNCLRRHELPRLPADITLTTEQFTAAVVHAPTTRPERFTILEHLDLSEADVRKRVDDYVAAFG
ncbi:MAG TPA: iron-containing alcohol dehydrogenase family protein [Mycobacteriales bacterium]|jgi:glycerol-1-phosphate dehydrogenase [NAD(P)+]|nr:iron-containing alcohol dehydrogenase family protein [Mycobacteriales bacterium]